MTPLRSLLAALSPSKNQPESVAIMPKSPVKEQSTGLIGRHVLVPSYVWPTEKPKRGAKGWEGRIMSKKKGGGVEQYNVKFEGDANVYFFDVDDIRAWLLDPSQHETADENEEDFQDADEQIAESPGTHEEPKKRKLSDTVHGVKPLPPKPEAASKKAALDNLMKVAKGLRTGQVEALVDAARDMLSA